MSRLENWKMVGWGSHYRLVGEIYSDERFLDGTTVTTSSIQEIDELAGWAQTRNTRYELGKKFDG